VSLPEKERNKSSRQQEQHGILADIPVLLKLISEYMMAVAVQAILWQIRRLP
jgi:hypothetical protein